MKARIIKLYRSDEESGRSFPVFPPNAKLFGDSEALLLTNLPRTVLWLMKRLSR